VGFRIAKFADLIVPVGTGVDIHHIGAATAR
jgi:hypothetical protein